MWRREQLSTLNKHKFATAAQLACEVHVALSQWGRKHNRWTPTHHPNAHGKQHVPLSICGPRHSLRHHGMQRHMVRCGAAARLAVKHLGHKPHDPPVQSQATQTHTPQARSPGCRPPP